MKVSTRFSFFMPDNVETVGLTRVGEPIVIVKSIPEGTTFTNPKPFAFGK